MYQIRYASPEHDASSDHKLRTLSFHAILESGYTVTGRVRQQPKRSPLIQACLRIRIGDKNTSQTIGFYSSSFEGVETACWFPYIADDGRLRVWNATKGEDAKLVAKRGVTSNGFEAGEVRRRWPRLFELAQSEGFWPDE